MMNGLGVECLKNIHFYFQNEYFVKESGIILKMKTNYLLEYFNYLPFRTAIEAEILFAVCLSKKQALTGGKSLACEDKCI